MADRTGRQTPTRYRVIPYSKTYGTEAIDLYNTTGSTAMEWQQLQVCDIMAVNEDNLWTHSKYGYEVSRRNGKSEIAIIRALWGLKNSERILYTAHRTDTAHAVWERLLDLAEKAGLGVESSFRAYGKEHIYVSSGGRIEFRTRTSSGGLGTGYDLLILDEAQEYTTAQESALKYVISATMVPQGGQTLYLGTPPTLISSGTVFRDYRASVLGKGKPDSGWAEWSVYEMHNPYDKDAWYETNPSLGILLTERAILSELSEDELDHNIQRLGYWTQENLKSAISLGEWNNVKVDTLPELRGKLYVGIKYSASGSTVAMSIAVKTTDGKVFVEAIDCQSARMGTGWIIRFLQNADLAKVVVDGKSGQTLLADEMHSKRLKAPILPKTDEVITANTAFENAITAGTICHMGQLSLTQSVTNCDHRPIGNGGGYGYRSLHKDIDVSLLESASLAHWICMTSKERRKQRVSY